MQNALTHWYISIQLFGIAICIAFAYIIARFGVAHFNKVFSGIFVASAVGSPLLVPYLSDVVFSTEPQELAYWGVAAAAALGILLFGRLVAHFLLFSIFAIAIIALTRIIGFEASPAISFAAFAASAAVAFLLRRHTIKVLVGIASGLYLSPIIYSALVLLFTDAIDNFGLQFWADPRFWIGASMAMVALIFAVPVVLASLGIAVQYLWYDKIFGKKGAQPS
jgi:hypothetical protein